MKINSKTKIFCVIGDPIEHSLSPAMHNAVFEKLGINCTYVAFRVKPENLGAAISGFKSSGVGGVNVTIPHKVSCIKYLDGLSKEAEIIGAVNTIKIGDKLIGYNTDGKGALMALKRGGANPKGKNVVILGSGGAARAIAVTLALEGRILSLNILGVVKEELAKLTGDVSKNTKIKASWKILTKETLKVSLENADIMIHCTPVGMHPKVNETIANADLIPSDIAVMDIVYTPLETKLMKEAKKAGVRKIISGVEMFINQGAASEKIWLGVEAPVDLMRKVVLKELKK